MIRNNDKQHFLSEYCSLNKSIVNATINGKLITSEIYILSSIYKLLTKCNDSLTEENKNKLSLLYNHVFYNYSNICKTYDIINSNSSFDQNSLINTSSISLFKYIHYWQEKSYSTTFDDIKQLTSNPLYVNSKPFDTFPNFEKGVTISYTDIGRLCFVLKDTTSNESYLIFDILNNDITNSFYRHYDNVNKYILSVSKNIYSHGDIFIKIKKLDDDFSLFNNIFNNIFS